MKHSKNQSKANTRTMPRNVETPLMKEERQKQAAYKSELKKMSDGLRREAFSNNLLNKAK